MASKNKKKKTKIQNQNNKTPAFKDQKPMESESKKLDSLPPKQDPIFMTDTQKLFEKVKAKVVAIKAAKTTNACNIPSNDISASTPENAYPLEKKNENEQRDYLCDLSNVSQREQVTAATDPLLVRNRAQRQLDIKNKKKMKRKRNNENKKKKTADIKIQAFLEQSDNISPTTGPTSSDPVEASLVQELPECKKKKNSKEKNKTKKMTADIKIQTLLKQLDNISSIFRCCPTCFDPVKESLLQVLPQYEVPVPVSSNFGPYPEIIKCENDNSTALKPKKKKKKKTTNIKIQTLLEQTDNISPMVECSPASLDPVEESLVQELPEYENIKHELWPKKQDPISEKDLEKSLEEVKVNIDALEGAGNTNARNISFHDMSASTPEKTHPLEKIIEKEGDCLGDLLNFPQVAKRDEG